MRVDLFDFDLPADRIALRPARPRDARGCCWSTARRFRDRGGARPAGPASARRRAGVQRHQGHSRRSSKAGAARRGSARPCTSARARAAGGRSCATPSGCAIGDTVDFGERRDRVRRSNAATTARSCCTSTATSRSSCCSSAPGGCRCRPTSPRSAAGRRGRPRRLPDDVRARGGRGRRADRGAALHRPADRGARRARASAARR